MIPKTFKEVIDLGDGVFGFEFHSKMNSISGDILAMTHKAVKRAEEEGIGLVVGNHGTNFSVGANLMMIAVALAEGAFEDIHMAVRAFQRATMALKYAKVPVVAAPRQGGSSSPVSRGRRWSRVRSRSGNRCRGGCQGRDDAECQTFCWGYDI